MTKPTAIVFDMDGLMVDTEPLSRRVWAQLLLSYGHDLDDETYVQMIGRRSDISARIALEAYNLPLTASELIRRKEQMYDLVRANGVPVMPGLMELQAEVNRRRIPWGVATSSPRHHAEIILAQLGLLDKCQAIAGGDEVVHGKPSPEVYLLAAERLKVDPTYCLALEDSQPGSEAAVAAGMTVVAIPQGQTKTADFGVAHHVFDSLFDVLERLDSLVHSAD